LYKLVLIYNCWLGFCVPANRSVGLTEFLYLVFKRFSFLGLSNFHWCAVIFCACVFVLIQPPSCH